MNRSQLHDELPEPIRRYFLEVGRMQPPADLLQTAVAEIEGAPRTHRFAALPLLGWVATAAVVAGLLIYTLMLPGLRNVAIPDESHAPVPPSPAPSASAEGPAAIRVGSVTLELGDPGWEVRVQEDHRVVGFDDATGNQHRPLTYGWLGDQTDPQAHGVVVAELTDVDFHTNDQPPHAQNATEFFDNLAVLNMGSVSSPSYDIGAIEETELSGWPALTAGVEANTGYALFEGGPDGHLALSLYRPQQLIVADVGSSIVLVQIWAGSAEELSAWLPRAQELIDTLTLTPAN